MAEARAPATVGSASTVPVPYHVVSCTRETDDTVTLELAPVDGGPSLGFAPGQFDMLAAVGIGEVPISISGATERGILHTVRAVGAATEALVNSAEGAVVGVRGPFGTAWPVDAVGGRDVVVVAGGIGLAPLRPAIRQVVAQRETFGRAAVLVGARSDDLLLFRDELQSWRSRFDLQVEAAVDHAGPSWRGHVGVVTQLVQRLAFDPKDALGFVCGPEVMMRFTADALLRAGLAPEHLWVSLERNMQCGLGRCGHCQLSSLLLCRDGPVVPWARVAPLLDVREL